METPQERGKERMDEAQSAGAVQRSILWRGVADNGQVALTFDDGPHPVYTAQILGILSRHGVGASFFPLGRHVERHPELAQAISSGGHTIGNHSWTHRKLLIAPRELIRQEMARSSAIIAEITGQRPRFFRPPWGLLGWQALREARRLGMQTVLWSVSSRDYRLPGSDHIVKRVLSRIRPGSIVLLHDAKYDRPEQDFGQTVRALPDIIRGIQGRGLRLVTLTDLAIGRCTAREVQAR